MTQLFTFSEQKLSCRESGPDDLLGDATSSGDGISTGASQVIAVGADDLFDQPEVTQTPEVSCDAGSGQVRQERFQIGPADAANVELGMLERAQQVMLDLVEEIEAFDAMPVDFFGRGQFAEATRAGGEVIESAKEFQVATVAAEEDFAPIDQAVPRGLPLVVDRLLDGRQFLGGFTIPVFHLAVVLEEGNIMGGGFNTQHLTELVVHLDRVLAQPMLDAGALDAGGQATLKLLRQLRRQLLAQEMHHLRRLHRNDSFPGKGFVEGLHDRGRTKGPIGRTLDLHQTPVVGLAKDNKDRTALLGMAIQNPVQDVRGKIVSQRLRLRPVANTEEGVVGQGVIDAGSRQLPGQPTVAITVELKPEGTPRRHAQIDQTPLRVDEIEVVVQALARRRAQKGLMGALVMPRLVRRAGFHDRDDMNQSGVITPRLDHLGDHRFLAHMRLGDVLNAHPGRCRQGLGVQCLPRSTRQAACQ